MSAWDESHWVDYEARINNVFAGGGRAWIDFSYVRLGRVGWRPLRDDIDESVSRLLDIATAVMTSGKLVLLRVTNGGDITAIQTL